VNVGYRLGQFTRGSQYLAGISNGIYQLPTPSYLLFRNWFGARKLLKLIICSIGTPFNSQNYGSVFHTPKNDSNISLSHPIDVIVSLKLYNIKPVEMTSFYGDEDFPKAQALFIGEFPKRFLNLIRHTT